MKILTLALFLAAPATAFAPSAQAPPTTTPAVLPGDLAVGLAGGDQREAAIAAGGPGYLVAWSDRRAQFSALVASGGSEDVFAMRLDALGNPLDALSFPVAGQELYGEMQKVRVAWNGAHWLVAWQQQSPTEFFHAAEILGVRVAPDGSIVDATPISILKYQSSSSVQYALESDGGAWIVVAQGSSGGESDVRGVRIGADGSVLDPGGQTLFTTFGLKLHFDLAFAQGTFLLVWADSSGIRGRRIAPDLTVLGAEFVVAGSSSANFSAVASNGVGFAVAWEEGLVSGARIRMAQVSSAGAVGAPIDVTPGGGGVYHRDPDVAWSGTEWVLAFESGLFSITVSVARVTAAGAVLDFGGVALDQGAAPRDPVVASAGAGRAQVAWPDANSDAPPDAGDVFGTHVGPGVAIEPAHALSIGASRQGFPDLAAGGLGHLAVFRSERGGTVDILAQRLDSFGSPLDLEPVVVASGDALRDPAVAWNGAHFLVVWEDLGGGGFADDTLRARRMLSDGSFVDAAPFDVMAGINPDVAAAGDVFLVVGTRFVFSEIQRAFAARVDGPSGAVLDPGGIEIGPNFAQFPEVAGLGDRWVATWQRNFSHDDPKSVVQTTVILADGSTTGAVTAGGSGTAGGAKDPTVAANDAEALVVWVDGTMPSEVDLRARRIGPGGAFLGGIFPVSSASGAQTAPDAAWNGAEFTVAWEDLRNEDTFFDERPDVFAARVAAGGVVLDPSGFAVATAATHERHPTVSGAFGDTLFAFASFEPDTDSPWGAYRIAISYQDEWQHLGGGIPGVAGVPALHAEGELIPGTQVDLILAHAAPSSAGAFVIGLSELSVPFLGGTLVPSPTVVVPLTTDGGGGAQIAISVPPSLLSGTQLWIQAFLLDPAAPQLVAGTDALTQIAP